MKRAAAAALAVLGLACVSAGPPSGPKPEPAESLVPTSEIAGNFLMRQQLVYEAGEDRGGFEALVQKRCDELVVVGLTPFGSRAFTLRQRGVDVQVETHVDLEWPFPPRRILLDVHRVFLLPIANPPPADGVTESRWGSEIVTERWASGVLRERRFTRADGRPQEEVVVVYLDGASSEHAPIRVRVENRRFGYTLEATSIERRPLSCP
jgi:hypothetical protein